MPTRNNDTILVGGVGNEVVDGLGGADAFHWTPFGRDSIFGGDYGDNYDLNPYGGFAGGDWLYVSGNRPVKVVLSSTEAGVVTVPSLGSAQLDFFGIERIHLTDGNDTINGARAIILPAHGATPEHGLTIRAGGGNDYIMGSRASDNIDGGSGNDTIHGGSGNDFIDSSTGNDLIYGGEGNENIRWGIGDAHWHNPGNDTIYGGGGWDLINIWVKDGESSGNGYPPGGQVSISSVRADGSFAGTATVGTDNHGGVATLRFQGFEMGWTHEGNDTVSGADARVTNGQGINWNTRVGNDHLTGTSGNDTLVVDDGRDTIIGGAGDDQLWIGQERAPDRYVDTLVFRQGFGHDTVYGFGANDVLDLGGQSYRASENAQGTLLTFASGDTILIAGNFDFI